MAASVAVAPIPDRAAFMEKVATRFRSFGRKVIQVAKKAGNWVINLTPVRWAWNVAKSAASKVWSWGRPALSYTHRYIVQPAAMAGGAILALSFSAKILALLAGLGVVGMIGVTIYTVRNWRGKEKVVGLEIVSDGSPEEPEEPEKPKRPRKRRSVITERIEEVLEEVTEVLEEQTEAIEAKAARVETAAKAVAAAKAEVQTEAPIAAPAEATSEAEPSVAPTKNGKYKVRLAEGDLDPNETLAMRFNDLNALIEAEKAKEETDPEYLCELQGRRNLIHVRAGKHNLVKKDATVADIHNDFLASLQEAWKNEHPGEEYDARAAGHYGSALYLGAQAESGRVTKVRKLKAEHDRIKGKAA